MNPLKALPCVFRHHDMRIMSMRVRDREVIWKLYECRRCGRLKRRKP